MRQKSYRRLTRFLFLLLFLLFFLLYLLLRGQAGSSSPRQNGGGLNWKDRHLELGNITLSEIRSSGFIVNDFPLPATTLPTNKDFEEQVLTVSTAIYNEGEVEVTVTPSVYGTKKSEDAQANPGLHCGVYLYSGDTDPAAGGYAPFLATEGWTVIPREERALDLHVKDHGPFTLQPGETRQIVLFFWADENAMPSLTDLVRDAYSVTVKLTSRASA